jgi:hypothetical protein
MLANGRSNIHLDIIFISILMGMKNFSQAYLTYAALYASWASPTISKSFHLRVEWQ